jgi:hypothetical protein
MLYGGCKLDYKVSSSPRSRRIGRQWRENEVLPKNPYNECTVSRPDVRLVVTRRTYTPEPGHMVTMCQGNPFHQTSHSSYFPYFIVVLVELGLIEGFSQIWRTRIFRIFRRHLLIKVSFNSYNTHCYFSCTACLFCLPNKHAYFTTLTVYTYCK